MAKEHLNYDQMGLTHGQISELTTEKETKELLAHVVDNSPTPVIGRKTGGNHIQLLFKDDGMIVLAASPTKRGRSVINAEGQIRKSLASHGFDFPKRTQVPKKKKKDAPEGPPAE